MQSECRLLHIEVHHETNIPHVGFGDNRPSSAQELLGVESPLRSHGDHKENTVTMGYKMNLLGGRRQHDKITPTHHHKKERSRGRSRPLLVLHACGRLHIPNSLSRCCGGVAAGHGGGREAFRLVEQQRHLLLQCCFFNLYSWWEHKGCCVHTDLCTRMPPCEHECRKKSIHPSSHQQSHRQALHCSPQRQHLPQEILPASQRLRSSQLWRMHHTNPSLDVQRHNPRSTTVAASPVTAPPWRRAVHHHAPAWGAGPAVCG